MALKEETDLFENYALEDTVSSELNNNLTIVNAIVTKKKLVHIPEFYIIGGAAMVFHALRYEATLDIDAANRISEEVRQDVSMFIDDAASEVSILPYNYKNRAVRIREDLKAISVYILSKEDLLINKLLTGRRKDITAIKTSGLLEQADKTRVAQIYKAELSELHQKRLEMCAKASQIALT